MDTAMDLETAAETSTEDQDHVADITVDGDVVLIVGEGKVRLRVYSQCLRSASKVFGAMFGPNWSEGQRLSTQSPEEVSLPEDYADAMQIICYVLHHRHDLVPDNLTAKLVLRIAVEADKYHLRTALKYTSPRWLEDKNCRGILDRSRLLAAAFLFDNKDAYTINIKDLVLNHSESYLGPLKDDIISQVLPLELCYLLEEQRTAMRTKIWQALMRTTKDICECEEETRVEKQTKLLTLPITMFEIPISNLIATVAQVYSDDLAGRHTWCGYTDSPHDGRIYEETLLGTIGTVKEKAGFSIDFVRRLNAVEVRDNETTT